MIEVLLISLIASIAAYPYQSVSLLDDGTYQFFYETGEDAGNQYRSESRGPDGVVEGRYGYLDPTGEQRVVNYRADDFGYVAKGDVSVAGAPKGQFPAESEEHATVSTQEPEHADQEEKKQEEKEEEKKVDNEDESKDSEEEEKTVILHGSPADSPPDGFPVDFFSHFQGLRRLPEPVAEEVKEEEETKKTTDDSKKTADENKSKTEDSVGKVPHHDSHFSSFTHPAWHGSQGYTSGIHQPVYVYSYQHPQAHGYYYFY